MMKIIYPEREIFLYDDKITASIKEQQVTNIHDHVEYVPFVGSLIFVEGAEYPKKGFPTPESVWATNQIKIVFTEGVRLLCKPSFVISFLLTWNKINLIENILQSYNKISLKALRPYLLKDIYMIPTTRSINNIVLIFLTELGINQNIASDFAFFIAHIFEYDDAYRYRIQDIMTNTSSGSLKFNVRNELSFLVNLFRLREVDHFVATKFNRIISILSWLLLIPSVKKAFIKAIDGNIEGMHYDEADWYWVSQRNDFLFGGMTYEERFSKLTKVPKQLIVNHE